MIKFLFDCGIFFCCYLLLSDLKEFFFCLKFNIVDIIFWLDVVEFYVLWDLELSSEGGFMVGDFLLCLFDNLFLVVFDWKFDFVFN